MQSGSASLTHASLSTELGDVDEADLEAGETLQQLSSAVTRYEPGAGTSPAAGGWVRGVQLADRDWGGTVQRQCAWQVKSDAAVAGQHRCHGVALHLSHLPLVAKVSALTTSRAVDTPCS